MNLLIVGDSISEEPYRGGGSTDPGWTARFRALCREPALRGGVGGNSFDYDIDVLALSGQSYLSWLSAVANRVALKRPNQTIVLLGTNDLTGGVPLVNLADFLNRAQTMWSAILASESALAVCSIPPIGFAGPTEIMRASMNDLILSGQGSGLSRSVYIDTPIDPNRYISQASAPSLWKPGLGQDTLHPNGRGSRVLGDAIWAGFHNVTPTWIETERNA